MESNYQNNSNYANTNLNSKYLDLYNPPLTRETLSEKTLSFILTFLNGVLIDRILRRFNIINNGLRFFITLF